MKLHEIKAKGKGDMLATFHSSIEVAKNNKKYLKIKLCSAGTDIIYLNVFEDNELFEEMSKLPDGAVLDVNIEYLGKNGSYENYSISSYTVKRKEKNTKIVDVNIIKQSLKNHFASIESSDTELYALIIAVYGDDILKGKIFEAPNSEQSGYSFRTGYATHVVRLCNLVDAVCSVYNTWNLNLDGNNTRLSTSLLKTASILHDIGNVIAYEMDENEVVKTFKGELHEPSLLSFEILLKHINNTNLTDEQKTFLKHVIASAKEKQSFGAIDTPRTREAIAFSLLERLDSSMATMETIDREALGDFYQLYQKNYCTVNYSDI